MTTGKVGKREQFHTLKGIGHGSHYPDGSCINSEGQMWGTHFFGKCLELYKKGKDAGKAEVVKHIDIPASNPTCTCLGGPNLDWLFCTSSQ